MFLREGLDTGVAEQPVVGQIRKGQNLLSHPNPDISSLLPQRGRILRVQMRCTPHF
jgi:hypothetical protein